MSDFTELQIITDYEIISIDCYLTFIPLQVLRSKSKHRPFLQISLSFTCVHYVSRSIYHFLFFQFNLNSRIPSTEQLYLLMSKCALTDEYRVRW